MTRLQRRLLGVVMVAIPVAAFLAGMVAAIGWQGVATMALVMALGICLIIGVNLLIDD